MKNITALEAFNSSPEPCFKHTTYFDVYDKIFGSYQNKNITFVEVGILNGGSLFMWREFFGPKARIIGIDLNPDAKKWEKEGFEIYIGSQSDPTFWANFISKVGLIDVFLDDGGHTYLQQIITSECVIDSISDGGLMVIEDTHTSYLPGSGDQKYTFVNYVKLWIDKINSRFSSLESDQSSKRIWSVEVFESIVAFKINKKSTELKSQPIWNFRPLAMEDDFRNADNSLLQKHSEQISLIMNSAFSINGRNAAGNLTVTKDQLFGLLLNWIQQNPDNKNEIIHLISK